MAGRKLGGTLCGFACGMLAAASLGAVSGTAKWTGGAGDWKWSSAANWSFTDAQGAPLAFAAADWATKAMDLDFSSLPATASVTCDVAQVYGIGRVVFPATAGGAWALVGTADSNVKLRNAAQTYVVPAGTTLRWGLRHKNEWSSDQPITVTGGGTFIVDSEQTVNFYYQDLVVENSTLVYRRMGSGWPTGFQMAGLTLKGDAARVTFERDCAVGYLHSAEAAAGAQVVDAGTNTITVCSYTVQRDGTFTGQFIGTGTLTFLGGSRQVFAGAMPGFTGTVQCEHGDLLVDGPLADSAAFVQRYGGRLRLGCDQTLATLRSTSPRSAAAPTDFCYLGGVDIATDSTFTVTGPATGTAADAFCGRLTGGGSFVKEGADYTLNLKGASRYAGATRVKAGTLNLVSEQTAASARTVPPGAVVYLDFEDAADLGANRAGTALALTANNGPAAVAGRVGQGVYLSMPVCFKVTAGRVPADLLPGTNDDYTVSLWLKPDTSLATPTAWHSVFRHGIWKDGDSLRWLSFGDNKTLRWFGFRRISYYDAADPKASDDGWACFVDSAAATEALIGVWHHYVMVSRDRKVSLYLDGQPLSPETDAQRVPVKLTDELCIGEGYVGVMDEFVYAKGAWTAEQVAAEYARTAPAIGEARDPAADLPAPVAHWAFEDPDDIGRDSSGNGYDLAPMGNAERVVLEANRPGAYGNYALVLNANAGWADGFMRGAGDAGSAKFGALTLKDGVFPAKIPTGERAFTMAIRYQMPYQTGYTAFYWGGRELTTNGYFRVKDGNQPHQPKGDFWQFSSVKDNYHNATVSTSVEMGANVTDATWLTVVFTYSPETHRVRAYVDGVFKAEETAAVKRADGTTSYPNLLGEALYVGYCPDGTYNYTGVAVDDLRIYDCALTDGQVKTLVQALETGEVGPTLPRGTDVTVEAGARLNAVGAGHMFGSLAGAGTVEVASLARVAVTNAAAFTGKLEGLGAFRAEGGATVALEAASLAGFRGTFEACDGATLVLPGACGEETTARIFANGRVTGGAGDLTLPAELVEGVALTADAARLPAVRTQGRVRIPAMGRLVFAAPPARSTVFVLAEGGSLELPEDFAGWTSEPASRAYTVTFTTDAARTRFLAKAVYHGLTVIVR